MASTDPSAPTTITRQDLENKFKALQGEIQGKIDDKRQPIVATGVAIGVVVVVIIYLLGRRSGRKRTTLVEIRRV